MKPSVGVTVTDVATKKWRNLMCGYLLVLTRNSCGLKVASFVQAFLSEDAKKKHRPMVENEASASQLEALLTPAITRQEKYYQQLGLRDRILNLALIVAAVLTFLWPDVAEVTELTRMLPERVFCGVAPRVLVNKQ